MKYFIQFSIEWDELTTTIYNINQLKRAIKNSWGYEEDKIKFLEFAKRAVPGDMYKNYLVCVNLQEGQTLDILCGDTVKCLVTSEFVDGTVHRVGDLFKVDYKNIDYFRLNKNCYEVIDE